MIVFLVEKIVVFDHGREGFMVKSPTRYMLILHADNNPFLV